MGLNTNVQTLFHVSHTVKQTPSRNSQDSHVVVPDGNIPHNHGRLKDPWVAFWRRVLHHLTSVITSDRTHLFPLPLRNRVSMFGLHRPLCPMDCQTVWGSGQTILAGHLNAGAVMRSYQAAESHQRYLLRQ